MKNARFSLGLLFLSIGMIGCGTKVKFDQTTKLEAEAAKIYQIDAPSKDQVVSVSVKGDQPTTVFIFKQEDVSNEVEQLFNKSDKAIATSKDKNEHLFDAKIPAKQAFAAAIFSKKNANVTVSIRSK
jgi:hypothetical protein